MGGRFPDTATLFKERANRPVADAQVRPDGSVAEAIEAAEQPAPVKVEQQLTGTLQDWARVTEASTRLGMGVKTLFTLMRSGVLDGCYYRTGPGRTSPVMFNVEQVRARLVQRAMLQH